jgi:hypothetical protein
MNAPSLVKAHGVAAGFIAWARRVLGDLTPTKSSVPGAAFP